MKTINLSCSSIMFKMSFTYSWCRNYSNYLKSTRTRRTRLVFHATFSYILSLSVLQTIRSHRLKLTCLCFVDRKRFELFCICIFFLTQRNKGWDIFESSCWSWKGPSNRSWIVHCILWKMNLLLYYNIAASSVRQPTKFIPIDL